nr:hypothetical protein Hi04_10k_c4983_00013 [uncultured bacterium]
MLREPLFFATVIVGLFAGNSFAQAQAPGFQFGPAATAELMGAATVLQLRIPFGGREQERARPTFTLNTGPLYREQSDATYLRGKYFAVPSVQMGYSADGDPVLTVGSTDLMKKDARPRRGARSLLRFFER